MAPATASGVRMTEQTQGGTFTRPGAGHLFYFDVFERGPDLAYDLTLEAFERLYGSVGTRPHNLLRLHQTQRLPGVPGRPGLMFISRVRSATAVKGAIILKDRTPVTPVNTLQLTAKGAGLSGNSYSATIADGRVTGAFDLTLTYKGVTVETFRGLNMILGDANYVVKRMASSDHVDVVDMNPTSAAALVDNPAVGVTPLAAGTDGAAIAAQDYIDALNRFAPIRLSGHVYTPQPAVAVATAMLALGTYKFAVIDTPASSTYTASKAFRQGFDSSWGVVSRGEGYTTFDPSTIYPLGIAVAAQQSILDQAFGPHYPASNYPMTGVENVDPAYLTDVTTNGDAYELDGLTTFRTLAGGGFGPFGLSTATYTKPFNMMNVRRTFWYAEEQLQNILAPFIHRRVLTPRTFADMDDAVEGFITGAMEPVEMVVGLGGVAGKRGTAWDWKADGSTTPQSVLDDGGLFAKFGLKIPRAVGYVEVTLSEFTAPAVVETVGNPAKGGK